MDHAHRVCAGERAFLAASAPFAGTAEGYSKGRGFKRCGFLEAGRSLRGGVARPGVPQAARALAQSRAVVRPPCAERLGALRSTPFQQSRSG